MNNEAKIRKARSGEISARVSLCSGGVIQIAGLTLTPDATRAYVECELAHAFPVVTSDKTAIHPQVLANSYRSMLHKVFNLSHLMRSYNPAETPRDRILGTVIAVEFPPGGAAGPEAWAVQPDREKAPGMRAVAVMHRQAEQVEEIIDTYRDKRIRWTVSMEQDYFVETSGLLVRGTKGVEPWAQTTPPDLQQMGWTYVPCVEAPEGLMECLDEVASAIKKDFQGQETVVLFGGLNNEIHFKGIGLTPLGKEAEAQVSQMLAGRNGIGWVEMDGELVLDLTGPLRAGLKLVNG